METMAISEFKATCLAVLKRIRLTGESVLITRFGEPMAEIIPPSPPARPEEWLGSMRGTATITGDIVAPVVDEEEWEVLRP